MWVLIHSRSHGGRLHIIYELPEARLHHVLPGFQPVLGPLVAPPAAEGREWGGAVACVPVGPADMPAWGAAAAGAQCAAWALVCAAHVAWGVDKKTKAE